MIKLCVFDMDGLLVDSERYMWFKSLSIAAQEQGKVMTDEFHSSFMGKSLKSLKPTFKKAYGQDFDVELFYKRIEELNKGFMKQGIPLMKGARQLLDYLHSKSIKTCIGTGSTKQETMDMLTSDNLLDEFDAIVCGDDIEKCKPDPEIYLKCYEKFNFDKSEILVLEDGEAGAKAAIAAGIRLILVPDVAIISQEVKDQAYRVVNDLSQVIDIIKEENETTTSI